MTEPDATTMNDERLVEAVASMRPWHHDIALNERVTTGKVFSPDGTLTPVENDGVSLISPRARFMKQAGALFPDGLGGKRFLDCACNAGVYCFLARELDCAYALGFDVRSCWLEQARFVQRHRTLYPTDRIDFQQFDVMELPGRSLEPFDLTYFKGIFYHLPEPVTALKRAADLTTDLLLVNTAGFRVPSNPRGMSLALEGTEPPMSGVHRLSWMPNSPEVVVEILKWMGFKDFKLTLNKDTSEKRTRFEILAGRTEGRLERLEGEPLV